MSCSGSRYWAHEAAIRHHTRRYQPGVLRCVSGLGKRVVNLLDEEQRFLCIRSVSSCLYRPFTMRVAQKGRGVRRFVERSTHWAVPFDAAGCTQLLPRHSRRRPAMTEEPAILTC